MAASISISPNPSFTSTSHKPSHSLSPLISPPHSFKFPSIPQNPTKSLTFQSPHARSAPAVPRAAASSPSSSSTGASATFHGLCYVYEKLGSYALCGLPASYPTRFVEPGETKTKYSIVIGGANFGCGSSREHAPVALGAAGTAAVVAESYARIFFRNSVATGEVYPLESEVRICEECRTGDVITIELAESRLINHTTGKEYKLKPIGDAGPVIEAGGIFAYARNTGMIPSQKA
ncbi:Aconitase/isopropylmalate dehydratase [Trema orientale]|uniref:Aconitase/isopropylmalate dehydratase n=1 Tax=Trema orientale TaxID=63057 RepID=A0A2P5FIT3_TREOI|nr:Aconitase/isopropylmalate dehydratase [Trema orientale]